MASVGMFMISLAFYLVLSKIFLACAIALFVLIKLLDVQQIQVELLAV